MSTTMSGHKSPSHKKQSPHAIGEDFQGIIEPGSDGYYHPQNEQEIINLVKHANQNALQLRVRGSGHSIPKAIFTGDYPSDDIDVNAIPPTGKNINIWLNQYNQLIGYHHTDDGKYLVTVQAGMHLIYDRNDPCSKEDNSLLYLLQKDYGLAITDLGGIARQTVSGVLCTGTAGGSLTYDLKENVYAMRIIDGKGEVYEVNQSDPDFNAALVSLGLLGVISTVTFECPKTFNIDGFQTCTTLEECEIDIFNDNPADGKRKGLVPFFQEEQYARILWWPEHNEAIGIDHQRLQVWRANKIEPTPDFKPIQFKLFQSSELMIIYTYLMSLMGNIEDLDKVAQEMIIKQVRFEELMTEELEGYGLKESVAKFFTHILQRLNNMIAHMITNLIAKIPSTEREKFLPVMSAACLWLFAPLDKANFINHFQPHKFQDYWWRGLPMDNTVDDVIVPDTFTEVWFPLHRATEVTRLLQQYFKKGGYQYYGNNMWELYTSKPSSAWMSMSYSNGKDEWRDGAFRIDPNWYIDSQVTAREFFTPLWKLLRSSDIPFRLHWAKLKPIADDNWRKYIRSQYPQIQKFLDLREKKDPKQIFVNHYWRQWFDI